MDRMFFALPVLCVVVSAAGCADDSGDGEVVFLATEEAEIGKSDRAAAPQVEIKVTLPLAQAARALSLFKLTKKTATERAVTFYDLPDLSLFEGGWCCAAARSIAAPTTRPPRCGRSAWTRSTRRGLG